MKPVINVYSSVEKLIESFSLIFKKEVGKALDNRDDFSFALSGGNTPLLLFDYLAENNKENINWRKVHFFWGDERCVPQIIDSN
jgi:6-phosphogluconolactonase